MGLFLVFFLFLNPLILSYLFGLMNLKRGSNRLIQSFCISELGRLRRPVRKISFQTPPTADFCFVYPNFGTDTQHRELEWSETPTNGPLHFNCGVAQFHDVEREGHHPPFVTRSVPGLQLRCFWVPRQLFR